MQFSLLFHHISTKCKDYEKVWDLYNDHHNDDGM